MATWGFSLSKVAQLSHFWVPDSSMLLVQIGCLQKGGAVSISPIISTC